MPLDEFLATSTERALQLLDDEGIEDGGDSEQDDDDSMASADGPVLALTCKCCGTTVSERGLQVFLVADPTSSLYSTDIPTDELREGEQKVIATCDCFTRTVHCCQCQSAVGYHVLRPCAVCGQGENNGHYWLFDQGAVVAKERGMMWSTLPYNGATSTDSEAAADLVSNGACNVEDTADESCCICAASPMWRRTRVEGCQHEFCFGCISREVDARGACPLDRRPITRDMLLCVSSPSGR